MGELLLLPQTVNAYLCQPQTTPRHKLSLLKCEGINAGIAFKCLPQSMSLMPQYLDSQLSILSTFVLIELFCTICCCCRTNCMPWLRLPADRKWYWNKRTFMEKQRLKGSWYPGCTNDCRYVEEILQWAKSVGIWHLSAAIWVTDVRTYICSWILETCKYEWGGQKVYEDLEKFDHMCSEVWAAFLWCKDSWFMGLLWQFEYYIRIEALRAVRKKVMKL